MAATSVLSITAVLGNDLPNLNDDPGYQGHDQHGKYACHDPCHVLFLTGRMGLLLLLYLFLYDGLRFLLGYLAAGHKQPVGIDTKWSACHQSTQITPFFNAKVGHIIGQYRLDLVYLVSKGFS